MRIEESHPRVSFAGGDESRPRVIFSAQRTASLYVQQLGVIDKGAAAGWAGLINGLSTAVVSVMNPIWGCAADRGAPGSAWSGRWPFASPAC
jgi:hypothetical protein